MAPIDKQYPIGKHYSGGTIRIEAAHAAAYAAATGAPWPGPVPPMLHVRLLREVMLSVATDPELALSMRRLVHGEHDATFNRPLQIGDTVTVSGQLEAVTEKASGLLVVSALRCQVDGEDAVTARTVYFIRAEGKGTGGRKPAAAPPPPDATIDWSIDPDQSRRYAEASGDHNPIHLDPLAARAAGLPDTILHGLCTMAMAGNTLTDALAGGDPTRLRRLAVRFAAPVFNDESLQSRLWHTADGCRFAVFNAAGVPVITNGIAQVSP